MNWWVLKRRIHTSWLLAATAASVVIGVWLASVIAQGWFAPLVWLVSGVALVCTALWWRYTVLIMCCVVGGLMIGLWRGSIDQARLVVYEPLFGATVELRGTVLEDIDQKPDGQFVMRLGHIYYGDYALAGTIWATTTNGSDVRRSDHIRVKAKVSEGFGNFSAALYRAKVVSVERPEPGDVALQARDWFADLVRMVVPEPQVSLGLGYLLGQRRSLPPELSEALQIAGLTHVIVASGYNLTILVRLARRLFMRISRFSALAAASGMVISFMAVTGGSPSMARAGLVTGLSLLAWYYGRKFHPLVLLPLAAAVTVLSNPSYAWGDIGWQLSFAAFAGVMILAPLLQAYFFGDTKPGIIRQIMGETISAQIATLPILIVAFGQVSNVALIANLLVLPLVPLAMLLVFLTGVSVWAVPFLAELLAALTTWLLTYMTSVTMWLASLPWAMSEVEVGWWVAGLFYAVLMAVCIYVWRATHLRLRDSNIVE